MMACFFLGWDKRATKSLCATPEWWRNKNSTQPVEELQWRCGTFAVILVPGHERLSWKPSGQQWSNQGFQYSWAILPQLMEFEKWSYDVIRDMQGILQQMAYCSKGQSQRSPWYIILYEITSICQCDVFLSRRSKWTALSAWLQTLSLLTRFQTSLLSSIKFWRILWLTCTKSQFFFKETICNCKHQRVTHIPTPKQWEVSRAAFTYVDSLCKRTLKSNVLIVFALFTTI